MRIVQPVWKVILLFSIFLISANTFAQEKINEAWEAISQGNLNKAEQLFLDQVKIDNSYRAHLGLTYLYELEFDFQKSWDNYYQAMSEINEKAPYLLASITSDRLNNDLADKNGTSLKLWEKYSNDKNDGYLNAVSNEILGKYYTDFNELSKAKDAYDKIGALTDWSVIGPFENISASGYYEKYGPENEFDSSKTYLGKNDIPVKWFNIKKTRLDKWIDFTLYFPSVNAVYYANTFVYSPQKQKVQLRVGTSGSFRLYLNDNLIDECYEERNNDLDTYVVETTLQKGWNRLLIKNGCSEISSCNFLIRITDLKGFNLNDLKYSTVKQSYTSKPQIDTTKISSKYEEYFEKQLKEHPDYPENYIILAEMYNKNDKTDKSELVLLRGLKKFPNNLVMMYKLLEVYQRKKRSTELSTIADKMYKISENIPAVLTIKVMQASQNKNLDALQSLLQKLVASMPDIPAKYTFEVSYYALKKLPQRVMQVVDSAYSKFPESWTVVNLKKNVDFSVDRDYNKAASITEGFLKDHYNASALSELANIYLASSKIDDWADTYNRLFDFNPVAPGYHYQMAKTYYSLQKYPEAEKAIKEAIDDCPYNSDYKNLLGDIYLAQNQKVLGMKAYEEALKYSPTNYDARKKLDDLKGDDLIEKEVKPFDIKNLMSKSPNADGYPGDDVVMLLDDIKRNFYKGGASEVEEQQLFKVLTKNGVEQLTDYYVDYNSNVQDLTIEKAVVIKADGSEIEGDKSYGHIVFKSLGVNDFVYLKFKKRNYFRGQLSNHFWEYTNFNNFFPIQNIRLSLIAPSNNKIYFNGQNMNTKPDVEKQVDGKTLYQWQMKDVPAIAYENEMPTLDDVGKVLYVSTIKNWNYISDWYYNITRSKIRNSFEIKDKVNDLLKGKENLSVKDKVKIIYNYIVENITYSSVSFRQSAYVPQSARDVLVNQIGDCKDVATLFIAMLNEIGVKANYVLVNTRDQGYNKNALPGIYFNHAIGEVQIDGKNYLCDLTAKDFPFGTLPSGDIGSFALEIKPGENSPFYIDPNNFVPNQVFRNDTVVVNDNNSVEVSAHVKRTGAVTASIRAIYNNKPEADMIKDLNKSLSSTYNSVNVLSLTTDDLDSLNTSLGYQYKYVINNFITKVGGYKLFKFPWADIAGSNPALSYDSRNYNYDYYPYYNSDIEELTVKLPEGYIPLELPKSDEFDCDIASYKVTYSSHDGILKAERKFVTKKNVVTPEEYKAFKDFMSKVYDKDMTQILLKNK